MRVACPIVLTVDERRILERWARGRRTQARLVVRSRIVLLAAEGKRNKEIGEALAISQDTVTRWRKRFADRRLAGIERDLPRGGRPPKQRERVGRRVVERTLHSVPANATHWSVRTMAKELGLSRSMVHRVWQANRLKPHLTRTFKLSNDPHFVEKLVDVVGLYMNPPEDALVLATDEKSQIQALDRTQPSLPIYRGRCGTMTHDYKRNGTTTLFAAIEVVQGRLIGTCMGRHRHQEWIQFLRLIDRETPRDLDLHLIVDNYQTHKHPNVQKWVKRHRRFHMHFIPTSSSWLNLIERWFRDLTDKCIRRGVFRSVPQLVETLHKYIADHNKHPTSFHWTAKANEILAKIQRARVVLHNQGSA